MNLAKTGFIGKALAGAAFFEFFFWSPPAGQSIGHFLLIVVSFGDHWGSIGMGDSPPCSMSLLCSTVYLTLQALLK